MQETDRNYRRGAIMGLTMAEAFVLICFALLMLFAFWQWEVDKENTEDVQAFRRLNERQRQTVLTSSNDGSIEAFIALKDSGVDFSAPVSVEKSKDKWRFIDDDELRRLFDAALSMPDDMQRDLADMVESAEAKKLLSEMAVLEDLVEAGQNLTELLVSSQLTQQISQSGFSLEELMNTAKLLEKLQASGTTVEQLIETASAIQKLETAGQTLEGISGKIRKAELQKAALINTLKSELGGIVANVGGHIDETGAIILPDEVLFQRGKASITPNLAKFLADACLPWLSTLKNSGVDIAEVKIEGHASSEWHKRATLKQAFLGNLDLSQRRSQAVLRVCLDLVPDPTVLAWARKHLIAVGYSSVRPILADGEEDKVASRRVVFSVTPNTKTLLEEIETEARIANYDRSLFGNWSTTENSCKNTRHKLLEDQSLVPVSLSKSNCVVRRGKWADPYTGQEFTNAEDVEIDHLVPLKWAWDRGAYSWQESKRVAFANDQVNLFVVSESANQNKRAKGPTEWLPPSVAFQCQYVVRFARVVRKYAIEMPTAEAVALQDLQTEVCR